MQVVVIGAGPAGLVVTKTLLETASPEFPFDPIILEQENDIGGTFRFRTYEGGTMVSSRQLTSFSDFRIPNTGVEYLPLKDYVQYLRDYVKHFCLEDRIQLSSKVVFVQRDPKGGHIVSYVRRQIDHPEEWETIPRTIHAKYIAVCTGLHVLPGIPTIPGIESISMRSEKKGASPCVFHSIDYKSRDQLAGRRVMILGTGETGMDLAYEAAKAGAKEVTLCSKNGFFCCPKALNNFEVFGFKILRNPVPIDWLITNLGETAYVHPWVAGSRIRLIISHFLMRTVLGFFTGSQAGCNQMVGARERHSGLNFTFLTKSHKAMPYINRPYRKRRPILDFVFRYTDPPEDSPPTTNFVVDLAPFPSHFLPDGRAVFPKLERPDAIRMAQKEVRPDTVIYATGYCQDFSCFDEASGYPTPSQANVRNVVKSGDESVGFIGFIRPGVGAIPPVAEMQSFLWVALLKGLVQVPQSPPHYLLPVPEDARLQYGVNHSAYISTLARDIGAAPGLGKLYREHGFHVMICYCFASAFTPFYRLTGPFRSDSAPTIVKNELWDTVIRRGVFINIFFGVIPMAFYGILNLLTLIVEKLWRLIDFGY